MGWDRAPVAAALAGMLAPLDPTVTVFAAPPESLNPPAFVVWYPQTVTYDAVTFGIDLVQLPILCAAGPWEFDRVDELVALAKGAVDADPSLAGSVAVAKAAQQTAWRFVSIAGAWALAADLMLEIRQ